MPVRRRGSREDGSGSGGSADRTAWSSVEPARERKGLGLQFDRHAVIWPPSSARSSAPEHQVPEMALKRREIKGPELASHPGERTPEIGRMIDQVGHDAAGRRALQAGLRLGPVAPMVAQDGLLGLHRRAIERIGLGERELEGPLMIADQPGMGENSPE